MDTRKLMLSLSKKPCMEGVKRSDFTPLTNCFKLPHAVGNSKKPRADLLQPVDKHQTFQHQLISFTTMPGDPSQIST